MANLGMETDKARAAAAKIKTMADGDLMNIYKTLNSEVNAFVWNGTDSLRFRETWTSEVLKQFEAIRTMLQAEGKRLELEAQQQEQASGGSASSHA